MRRDRHHKYAIESGYEFGAGLKRRLGNSVDTASYRSSSRCIRARRGARSDREIQSVAKAQRAMGKPAKAAEPQDVGL